MRYMIIGAGAGGISCAETLRKTDKNCEIIILSKDAILPYARLSLSDLVANSNLVTEKPNLFYIKPKNWYSDNNIELHLNSEVTKVEPDKKTVTTKDGKTYQYDKLVIDAGATPFFPPIVNINAEGVFNNYSYTDSEKITSYVKDRKVSSVAVVGGGALGLELADAFFQQNINITIIELMPQILGAQLDQGSAAYLNQFLKKQGIIVINNVKANEITLADGRADGLILSDGQRIKADMVVISSGARSNIAMFKDVLKTNMGIVVNKQMQTSDPNIYAVGDIVEFEGERPRMLWICATAQGEVAAKNICGVPTTYVPRNLPMILDIFGLKITAKGVALELNKPEVKIYDFTNPDRPGEIAKVAFMNGQLIWALAINNPDFAMRIYTNKLSESGS